MKKYESIWKRFRSLIKFYLAHHLILLDRFFGQPKQYCQDEDAWGTHGLWRVWWSFFSFFRSLSFNFSKCYAILCWFSFEYNCIIPKGIWFLKTLKATFAPIRIFITMQPIKVISEQRLPLVQISRLKKWKNFANFIWKKFTSFLVLI